MGTPQSPALELKDHGPLSSVNPQGKAVFTFVCTKLCRLLWCALAPTLSGEGGGSLQACCLQSSCMESSRQFVCTPPLLLGQGGGSPHFCPLQGPRMEGGGPIVPRLRFMANRAESPLPGLLTRAGFPIPILGNSASSGTPLLSMTLGILRPLCPT